MTTKEYQNIQTRSIAVRIELDLYNRVTTNFHHGQVTTLIRNIFESIDTMMKEDRLIEITNYIYKAEPLVLIPEKE